MSVTQSILFVLLIFTLTTGVYMAVSKYESNIMELEYYTDESHEIEDFNLTDQEGEMFSSADHDGKIWVVNYFFTSCPSICPKIMRNMQGLHDYIRSDEDILILSLTVDPKRDTPDRFMKYLDRFNINHETWKLLTGDKKLLYRLARKSFKISATEGAGDDEDFIHSENLVVIDPNGDIRAFVNGTGKDADDQIIDVIKKLKSDFK